MLYLTNIDRQKQLIGDNDILSMFLKQVFEKSTVEKKPHYLIGDLIINCVEYFENEKVSTFCSSLSNMM